MAATIYDVAETAGVSVSTVSRAFHSPELVRSATAERVREVANELGYVPNRAARSLTTGRTSNLGLIVPDIANPFFPAMVKAAQARAGGADYAVFLLDTDENPAMEMRAIRAVAKQVDGVIACSPRMSDEQLREAAGLAPLVVVNRRLQGIPSVAIDIASGIKEALAHLHALGHRSYVYLGGPRTSWSNRERRKAFRETARRLNATATVLEPFEPRYDAGLHAADRVLAEGATAVMAYNDLMALGVLARLADRGVKVPEEISVVGTDDILMAAMASPPLTTVSMPTAAAGRAAVELMLGVLNEPGSGERERYELKTELRVRGSTGPAREG